jgi:hypothetical protein
MFWRPLTALSATRSLLPMGSTVGALLCLATPSSAETDPLIAARAYHAVADVCINQMLSSKEMNSNLFGANLPMVVLCDCVARYALSSVPQANMIALLSTRRIAPEIDLQWRQAVATCVSAH